MKLVACTQCGSKEFLEDGGYVACIYCRSRFALQTEDLPPTDTVIDLSSDVRTLLEKCRNDPKNARRYASLALDIDPTNGEAAAYMN